MVTLQTERLTVHPCTAKDVTRLQQQQYENGPEVQHHLTLLASDPSMLYWGSWLVMTKDGQVVGDIGFKGKPDSRQAIEIGYGLLPAFHNRGFATEAVRALIDWVFDETEVKAVLAKTDLTNQASIRVLEKAGLIQIGSDDRYIMWERLK
ncbi:GNAT family N-acetyltransferase [Exiguobacterium acetylicum]|uniref:GNAT family N-acetyltransferase n=1 Tax=Exiguobacterium acetylicum TaxID=41170 RepID=UPI001EE1F28E|nr:GNAT family N-acetyltransferase [Exiguobacterium acetylicum]UKS54702.1 GNAT family N-acetyltransferase [Exiguobacterium acetylicum]